MLFPPTVFAKLAHQINNPNGLLIEMGCEIIVSFPAFWKDSKITAHCQRHHGEADMELELEKLFAISI